MHNKKIKVYSEIAPLKKVLVHSPDGGIGNVPANKLYEWLYDDLLDVKATQEEYASFQSLLLLFLNSSALFKEGRFAIENNGEKKKENGKKMLVTNPEKENYYITPENLENAGVIDTQFLLHYLFGLHTAEARELISAICAIEELHPYRKNELLKMLAEGESNPQYYKEIVKTLLTGKLEFEINESGELEKLDRNNVRFIFPPIPNFIFTRDIGVTIGDHLLITKPKFYIRKREVMLFRFIAEHFLCKGDPGKIISVTEDDDFFQIEEKNQPEYAVSYEGGDIMMISNRQMLIGCSERTSPYAIQKLVHRLFWENIETEHPDGIDLISVIRIGEKRSQMHIDTIFTQIREDLWVIHSPLSEIWQKQQETLDRHTRNYNDELLQKSKAQIEREKDLVIFQYYLNQEGKEIKRQYAAAKSETAKKNLKARFKKLDFLLRADENHVYTNSTDCYFKTRPKGITELLSMISVHDFGVSGLDQVKFVHSGMGISPYDGREQWTDACNLLTLRSGVSVGYDRNPRTILHFNEIVSADDTTNDPEFIRYIAAKNLERFKENRNSKGEEMELNHILHVHDLFSYINENNLSETATKELIEKIKNTLILIPSKELSRARGGSHCMTMPVLRNS